MYHLYFKIVVLLLLSFVICTVNASDVDLELQINIDISEGVEFQQTGKFSITLVNNSSEDAGGGSALSRPNDVLTSIVQQASNGLPDVFFRQNFAIAQDCIFIAVIGEPVPGGTPTWGFDIAFPVIPANSTVTCYGIYEIGFEQGERTITFSALTSIEDNDTNPINNSIALVFGIPPRIIPTTNIYSLTFLIVLILIFGVFHLVAFLEQQVQKNYS